MNAKAMAIIDMASFAILNTVISWPPRYAGHPLPSSEGFTDCVNETGATLLDSAAPVSFEILKPRPSLPSSSPISPYQRQT